MSGDGRLNILVFLLDFLRWEEARRWSYTGCYALIDGLEANGVNVTICPAYGRMPSCAASSWLSRAKNLLRGKSFDQVWVWLLHVPYDEDFFFWVRDLAPVRIGFICESLTFSPEELGVYRPVQDYLSFALRQIAGFDLTHVMAVDEADIDFITSYGDTKAAWWPACVPRRVIVDNILPAVNHAAAFYGTVYNSERRRLIGSLGLRGLLYHGVPPEADSPWPKLFDALNRMTCDYLVRSPRADDERILTNYIQTVRALREKIFSLWIAALQNWGVIVNLPSLAKCYPGRVVEAMAAGRPVVSWRVPYRLRNEVLFRNGAEILLYERSSPRQLKELVEMLLADPDMGRQIAERGRDKVLRYHTAEERVRQILAWVETGVEPDYGDGWCFPHESAMAEPGGTKEGVL